MPAALTRAAEGQDVVFHVAGSGRRAQRGGVPARQPGRDGERGRGRARGRARPRFVLVSSMAAGGPAEPGTAADRRRAARAGHGVRTQQARRRSGGDRERAPLDHRAAADGLRPARPGGAQGLSDRATGASPRYSATAARSSPRSTAPIWPRRSSRRGRPPRRSAGSTTPAIPKSSPAPSSSAPSAPPWGGGSPSSAIPAPVGRALLALTEAGARLTGQTTILTTRQGQRVLPGGLDRRSRSADPRHGMAGGPRSAVGLADTYRWYRSAGWL